MKEMEDDLELSPYPIWRVSYRYKGIKGDLSFDSYPTAEAAMEVANKRICDPNTYTEVRISWPHYEGEHYGGEGWISVNDLPPGPIIL